MQATESIRVDFTGAEIGPEALVGKPGDYYPRALVQRRSDPFRRRAARGAEAVAEAARAFLRELEEETTTRQAMRSGETAALLETGNLWLAGAAQRAERAEEQPEELVAYAALMRRTVERIGLEVMEHAVRSCGARALLRPRPLERLLRDLTMYLRQPAPDEVLARAGRFATASRRHFDELWR